jgi:lysophospholipase L1-like esterase
MFAGGAFGYLTDYLFWWVLYLSLLVHAWCFFRFFPRKRLIKSGLILGNGLVFMCFLGFVALAAESYFRFVCVETDAFGMSLPAQRWFALHTRLNSLGCRDEEWQGEPRAEPVSRRPEDHETLGRRTRTDVRRIAFVGDSFTYGWGIERVEDRFPDRIQAMFDEHLSDSDTDPYRDRQGAARRARRDTQAADSDGRVEIMNVAKPGWGTGDQLQPMRDMIDIYGVDDVVLCYVSNDIEKLLPRSPEFDPIRPPEMKLVNPSTSCLFDYLFHRFCVPRAATVRGYHDWLADGFADPDIWRRHQEQLYNIIRHCRDHDVTLRVVLLPYIRTTGEKFQPAKLHATLAQFFDTNGVQVVDLLPSIAPFDPADLMVNGHDAHPNEKANELFADAIWQAFYDSGS